MASLHFVQAQGAQIGMVGGFTAAFALSVGLMTNAGRAEIFTASAA